MIRQLLISALAMTSLSGLAITADVSNPDLSRKQYKVATSFLSLPKTTARQNAARTVGKAAPQDPITEIPEDAIVKEYSRFSLGYGIGDWGGFTDITDQGFAGQIAFCDNGDVYIKNPTSFVVTDTYIKGHLDGDKITFEFPQTVSKEFDEVTGTWVYIQACAMDAVYDETEYSISTEAEEESYGIPCDYKESEVQSLIMEQVEDGMIQLHLTENKALGYKFIWDETLEGTEELPMWAGISEYCIEWKPFTDIPLELPSGAKTEKWRLVHEGTGALLNIAFVDDDVYFQGLYPDIPEAWVKGTVGDGVITIASEQYLGLHEEDRHYVYLLGAHTESIWDPEFEEEMIVIVATETFDFTYDAEKKIMDFNGNILIYNGGLGSFYFLGSALFGNITYQGDATPAQPARPEITEFITDYADYGEYGLMAKMSPLDINGNLFDVKNLYYNIYINENEDPFIFDSDYYTNIENSMTEVPFDLNDEFDFIVYDDLRIITIRTYEDISKIGLQVLRKENDNVLKSEIAWYDPTSVSNLTTEKEISTIKYLDLSGRDVINPDKGIYLKVIRYTDGSSKTVKTIR